MTLSPTYATPPTNARGLQYSNQFVCQDITSSQSMLQVSRLRTPFDICLIEATSCHVQDHIYIILPKNLPAIND